MSTLGGTTIPGVMTQCNPVPELAGEISRKCGGAAKIRKANATGLRMVWDCVVENLTPAEYSTLYGLLAAATSPTTFVNPAGASYTVILAAAPQGEWPKDHPLTITLRFRLMVNS